MVLDYTGGFHISGHAVFDGYDGSHRADATANAQVVIADPLNGCVGDETGDGLASPTGLANAADMPGKIALIRRGVCYFTTKVINAQNAGAIGAVIYNDDRPGTVVMSGPEVGITIPSIFIEGVAGDALNAAVTADPTSLVSLHCDERLIYQICNAEDMVVDWTGGFHASGHAVFDGYGGVHDATLTAEAQVVIADPLNGCVGDETGDGLASPTGLANAADMPGKIALIRRGVCYFTTKVINAQNAGAIGAVIYNDDRPGTVVMSGPEVGITIVSIFIEGAFGDALNAAVTADPTTIVSVHCDE